MTLSEKILAPAAGVDLNAGTLTLASGQTMAIAPFPPFMERIVEEGGWIPYLAAAHGRPEGTR